MKKRIIAVMILLMSIIVLDVMLIFKDAAAHPEIGDKSCLSCHQMHGGKKPPLIK